MSDKHARLGTPVPGFTPPQRPTEVHLSGRYVEVTSLKEADTAPLFEAFSGADPMWDYMPVGPFGSQADLQAFISGGSASEDPIYVSFTPRRGAPAGFGSYLRIAPEAGSIEVGWLAFSPSLQRTPAATEAMYLMMRWAFETGYRRYEWKCNALNLASRRAAQRLGLSYEGVFRQATVVKGRNRDTAWFAAIDAEWPALSLAFETWLDPSNFDADGRQKTPLSTLTAPILVARDPLF